MLLLLLEALFSPLLPPSPSPSLLRERFSPGARAGDGAGNILYVRTYRFTVEKFITIIIIIRARENQEPNTPPPPPPSLPQNND